MQKLTHLLQTILGTAFLFQLSLFADVAVEEQRMGYKENVPWEKKVGKGYDGYYKIAPRQNPSEPRRTAEWTVALPHTPRNYSVLSTWIADKENSRLATYDIFDGERGVGRVVVNQQQSPRGTVIKGTQFQKLGSFRFTSKVIRIVLTSQTDGEVVSDSILVNAE